MTAKANTPKGADPTQHGQTRRTLREVLDSALGKSRPALKKWLAEMDGPLDPNEPMQGAPGASGDELDATPDHGQDLMQAVLDLVAGALDGADTNVLDAGYLKDLESIKEIATKYLGQDEPVEEGDDEPDADDKKESLGNRRQSKPGDRALREELDLVLHREHVRDLCAELGFAPRGVQLVALSALESDADVKALVEQLRTPATPPPAAPPARTPKSTSRVPGAPPAKPEPVAEAPKNAAEWLEGVSKKARTS